MGSSQSSSTSRSTGTTDDVLASNGEGSMVPPPPRDDNLTSQHNHNNSKNEDNHSNNKLQSISLLVDDERKKKKKKPPPPSNLTGFHLVQYKCRKKKKAYDICHSYKHSAFVSGKLLRDNEAADDISCEELFDTYKECIYKGMHEDRKRRGLPRPKEESALGMFVDDNT